MMAKKSRDKGLGYERELVLAHKEIGIRAERVPLSGGSRYQGNGCDIDIYRRDHLMVFEAKRRKAAWKGLYDALERDDAEGLFIRADNKETLVVLPWASWERILGEL